MKVILRTRCGSERIVEMDALPRDHIVPIPRMQTGAVDDFNVMEVQFNEDGLVESIKRKPMEFDRRTFRLQPAQPGEEMCVYLEQP